MKKFLSVFLFVFLSFLFCPSFIRAENVREKNPIQDCRLKGIPLHGKVKVVQSFADFKVKVVQSFPDLKVKKVSSFPDNCGEWQFVESFPDFTVQFVESFPDFTIQFVESFPGM